MIDRSLRARILLDEVHALGLDLEDLIAANGANAARFPPVRSYLEEIEPTFTPATAATYRPYWRLLIAHLGDRRVADVTIGDLATVVNDAEVRARARRPSSTGRATRESCVAALRAFFGRAAAAGLITGNPAAALVPSPPDPAPLVVTIRREPKCCCRMRATARWWTRPRTSRRTRWCAATSRWGHTRACCSAR